MAMYAALAAGLTAALASFFERGERRARVAIGGCLLQVTHRQRGQGIKVQFQEKNPIMHGPSASGMDDFKALALYI